MRKSDDNLEESIVKGDRLAIARVLTFIENEDDHAFALLNKLFPYTGRAYRLGITGPPGAGKSTLTNHLTKHLREDRRKVGIIAVDPTSPFSGGAILGDRIRMNELTLDKGVFIRSVASRGSRGGLARQANEMADVLDAAGYDYIIFETVGVGQAELDVAGAADTTVVMMVPEGGDIIQGLKAGLMEIADVFVLNKADRPDAERMKKDIEYVLHLREAGPWTPKVIETIASQAAGIAEMWSEVQRHQTYLSSTKALQSKRQKRMITRVERLIRDKIEKQFWTQRRRETLQSFLQKENKDISPYRIADIMLSKILNDI